MGLFKKWDAYFQFDSLRVLHNFEVETFLLFSSFVSICLFVFFLILLGPVYLLASDESSSFFYTIFVFFF